MNSGRDPTHRASIASKFKTTYSSLGLSVDDVAKLLHVTPRTLHNWNSGRHDIPFASFKLLRVLLRYELPHEDWEGWHFHRGKLYTPEGHSIAAHESSWWSLMLRRAEMCSSLYARCNELEAQVRDGRAEAMAVGHAPACPPTAALHAPTTTGGRSPQATVPNSFLEHISTMRRVGDGGLRLSAAKPIAKPVNIPHRGNEGVA
ncbi:VC1465 family Xer recombination activation factor [Hydrogenophaga sp.]|uniref:VC1465 family Xer recombination activation factor n=1 Tax=Hydrogenophaga sp. TaxID=1904254 RepID=UPI002ABA183F|nr:VC1465 family Xer recombination activation factor [Hydrogenophaga sp.]MDZ4397366.1 VC1465 family Xer recombination activation factor [Hydrogenophaga sp.]